MRLSPLVFCIVILSQASSLAAEAPIGEWLVVDFYSSWFGKVRIENCGGALWGVVSRELIPGQDSQNPDPALRRRPTLGMPILLDMEEKESAIWGEKTARWEGHFYNFRNGKTYEASIRLLRPDAMRLERCEPGGLFCGRQDWKRVQAPSAGEKGTPWPKTAAPNVIAAGEVCSRIPGRV